MKPSAFSECLAHPPADYLPAHLLRVAQTAAASIAPGAHPAARDIAFVAGLFHDIGKATSYFQVIRLQQNRKKDITSHAQSGAVLSWWYTEQLDWPLWQRLAVFNAVIRHHGALSCSAWRDFLLKTRMDFEDEDTLRNQLSVMDLPGIFTWLKTWNPDLSELTLENIAVALKKPVIGRRKAVAVEFELPQALAALAGFGGLLASDKLDAATEGRTRSRFTLPADMVERYKQRDEFMQRASSLNARRNAMAAELEHTWLAHRDEHLFTFTAPTGAGKTLAILNAALKVRHALATDGVEPRIIYCLPFTSVIDQNHKVFAEVMNLAGLGAREDILLKHHHLTDGLYRTENKDGKDIYEQEDDGAGQLLTETWQSEWVVTTFHQLLHSLLSKENGNLKRAGQLSGSIVLMDEVQAIPVHYWIPLRQLFQATAQALNTRFVLLTATRPLIFRPGEDARELLPSHEAHFAALSRVTLHWHSERLLDLEAFAAELVARHQDDSRSALVIVNRVKAVAELFDSLYEALGDSHKIITLSTLFTPRDRRARIRLIRRLLNKSDKPCIVISTQLVEAGVDLSFPVVHRALAPLDALVQSAGRCNRHNDGDKSGEMHVWKLQTNPGTNGSQELWVRVYDSPLIEATTAVLDKQPIWEERDFLALSQEYFHACVEHRIDPKNVHEWLASGDFDKIHKDFKLIEERPTRSVFIKKKPQDDVLWKRYEQLQENKDLSPWDKEREFRQFRYRFYERVIQVVGKDNSGIQCLQANEAYEKTTGYFENTSNVCV